jgi:hypothetical protein
MIDDDKQYVINAVLDECIRRIEIYDQNDVSIYPPDFISNELPKIVNDTVDIFRDHCDEALPHDAWIKRSINYLELWGVI